MRIQTKQEPVAFRKDLAREVDAVERANTKAIRAVSRNTKNELRRQTQRAGLEGLEKAWQHQTFPRNQASLNSAGFIFTKSERITRAFTEGGTIEAQQAEWLVIPLEGAIRRGFDRNIDRSANKAPVPRKDSNVRAAERELGRLRYVRTDKDTALLIHGGGGGTRGEPIFLLKRSVTIPKLLTPNRIVRKRFVKLKGRIQRELAKEDARRARRGR